MSPVNDDGDAPSRSKPILRKRKLPAVIGDPARVGQCRTSRCLHPVKPPTKPVGALSARAPRVQLLSGNIGCLSLRTSGDWAKVALSSFNKKCRALKEPEYELVEAQQCIGFPRFNTIFHCNFVARPKNGSEVQNKLFFAEVMKKPKDCRDGETRVYRTCSFCCIIEKPIDSKERGPSGCKSCDRHPGCVQHPLNTDGFISSYTHNSYLAYVGLGH